MTKKNEIPKLNEYKVVHATGEFETVYGHLINQDEATGSIVVRLKNSDGHYSNIAIYPSSSRIAIINKPIVTTT